MAEKFEKIWADPRNPSHFLACCGLLELAHFFDHVAEGCFEKKSFLLRSEIGAKAALERLVRLSPDDVEEVKKHKDIDLDQGLEMLRIRLGPEERSHMLLNFWVRFEVGPKGAEAVGVKPWKCWAGQQTPKRIWLSLQQAVQAEISNLEAEKILSFTDQGQSKFGFDPAGAWTALDAGFSPNDQHFATLRAPVAELLAAVGLQRFRPMLTEHGRTYHYYTWRVFLPPSVAALAAIGCIPQVRGQVYRGHVIERGSYTALGFASSQ